MHQILSYLKYYFSAKTVYNIHSPFVYDFILNILDTSKSFYIYPKLEQLRSSLLNNSKLIKFVDYGAGNNNGQRKISEIAKRSLSTKKQCHLLFNLVATYKPTSIIEFGTSLGISTLYLATANSKSIVYTLEGNPDSRQIAVNLFNNSNISNIKSYVGEFDTILNELLPELNEINLAFLDGNHQKEATINYFNRLLPKIKSNSIVVLDDIYWSKGMTDAWKTLKTHDSVTLSIDLYDIGILFFNKNLSTEHIALIDYWKKPWKLGIFG